MTPTASLSIESQEAESKIYCNIKIIVDVAFKKKSPNKQAKIVLGVNSTSSLYSAVDM